MTDNERIAEYLERHGSVTSYEIRVLELSGNPSQRINELTDAGYEIRAERYTREVHGKKRPACRYTLIASPEDHPRGGSSYQELASQRQDVAAISGAGTLPAQRGGDGDPSPTVAALPTLFSPDGYEYIVPVGGRYGEDAA